MSEHLAICSDCRASEAGYRSLTEAGSQLKGLAVSDGFNTALFNRIAQERFAETRTKAYLPKPAPIIRWAAVVPSIVAACLVIFVATLSFMPGSLDNSMGSATIGNLSDSYLTAQPDNNPNMTRHISKDWSLTSQLASAERINQRSQRVINRMRINNARSPYEITNVSSTASQSVPYVPSYYRLRQNVREYQSPEPGKGVTAVY